MPKDKYASQIGRLAESFGSVPAIPSTGLPDEQLRLTRPTVASAAGSPSAEKLDGIDFVGNSKISLFPQKSTRTVLWYFYSFTSRRPLACPIAGLGPAPVAAPRNDTAHDSELQIDKLIGIRSNSRVL